MTFENYLSDSNEWRTEIIARPTTFLPLIGLRIIVIWEEAKIWIALKAEYTCIWMQKSSLPRFHSCFIGPYYYYFIHQQGKDLMITVIRSCCCYRSSISGFRYVSWQIISSSCTTLCYIHNFIRKISSVCRKNWISMFSSTGYSHSAVSSRKCNNFLLFQHTLITRKPYFISLISMPLFRNEWYRTMHPQ